MNKALGRQEAGTIRVITSYFLEIDREIEGSALIGCEREYHRGSHCFAFAKRQLVIMVLEFR